MMYILSFHSRGMNFENMPELSVDKYSWFPGVKLLW